MAGFVDPFQPANNATTVISATSTSGFTQCPGDGECVELYNAGPNIVFINTAALGVTATVTTSYPVAVGQCKTIKMHMGDTGINAVCAAAGTATLYVSRGNGT